MTRSKITSKFLLLLKTFIRDNPFSRIYFIFSRLFYFIGHPLYQLLFRDWKQIWLKCRYFVLAKSKTVSQKSNSGIIYLGKYFSFLFRRVVSLGKSFFSFLNRWKKRLVHLFFFRPRLNRFAIVFIVLTAFTFLGFNFYRQILLTLPSPEKLSQRSLAVSTKIYDRNGLLLYNIYRNQNRTLVPLDQIPDFFVKATIAIEDREFWQHSGISVRGIIRSLYHNLTHPDTAPTGGSTITQQLIKNALLGSEKTWQRKIKEIILALMVEKRYTKKEILQMYFNEVPFGGTSYGVEEAAQKYFGKSVMELTNGEAALLAGLPAAPTRYSPFGAYPSLAKERQIEVLTAMTKSNIISENTAKEIAGQPLRFSFRNGDLKAPHFVFYTKDLLVENFGQQSIEEGGLRVTTSLDLELNQKVESIIQEELDKLKNFNVQNAAALVIRPSTGEILAMIGSRDYYDFSHEGNVNVVLSLRQPGSTIKIVNYALALQNGYTAATVIPDTPVSFRLSREQTYTPQNYDSRFHGLVSLRNALGSSLNVPAVKVLASLGVERMINMGKKMGITTWEDPNRFGLSLTLGGGEVKMIDLAQAYSILANLGFRKNISPFLTISQGDKNLTLTGNNQEEGQIFDPGIAFILNDILADNDARTLAFGSNSLLRIPNQTVAVKTGTSNLLRDNWAIGYTPSFLVAVWVGNNDSRPMSQIASGITGATPIWRRITELMLQKYPQTGWSKPSSVKTLPICRATGSLPCSQCPVVKNEYFLEGSGPKAVCGPTDFPQLSAIKNQ